MADPYSSYALSRELVDKLLETALFFRRIVMHDVWLIDEAGEPWKAPGPLCALKDWERIDSDLADLRLHVTEIKASELPPRPVTVGRPPHAMRRRKRTPHVG